MKHSSDAIQQIKLLITDQLLTIEVKSYFNINWKQVQDVVPWLTCLRSMSKTVHCCDSGECTDLKRDQELSSPNGINRWVTSVSGAGSRESDWWIGFPLENRDQRVCDGYPDRWDTPVPSTPVGEGQLME